jgi:hypothetical protein
MNVVGIVSVVYDNRLTKDGTPNKFPNFKFKIKDQEIVLWSSILHPAISKGKNISVTCGVSKKNGSLFVLNKPDKSPMIQELPNIKIESKPDTSFDPEELEAQLQEMAKDSKNGFEDEKKPFDKDEYMFVMAMCKSALESKGIECNKESIDIFIKQMKLVFKYNFNN